MVSGTLNTEFDVTKPRRETGSLEKQDLIMLMGS